MLPALPESVPARHISLVHHGIECGGTISRAVFGELN
jgi:hypothetical protein